MEIDYVEDSSAWKQEVQNLRDSGREFLATEKGLIYKQVEAKNYTF